MLRKLCIAILCSLLSACSPDEADVESKPFEEPTTDGFETLSMQEPLALNRASWFFWKKAEDMPTAMKLGAGLEIVGKNIAELKMRKVTLTERIENYALESLGPDNKQIWEELRAKLHANNEKWAAASTRLELERTKPEAERDENLITQLEQDIASYSAEFDTLTERIETVEQQSGVPEFGNTIRNLGEQIAEIDLQLPKLQQTAQTYQQQLSQIVELIAAPPKLILQETEAGLKIQLVDFQKDGVECSTDTGLIRSVVYNKQNGYIEFTAICKQPEWATQAQLVSYKIILEKIPSSPTTLLSGNMGRCVDNLPNVGKCEAGLATGVVKYQQ